jgi:hypothetical protein
LIASRSEQRRSRDKIHRRNFLFDRRSTDGAAKKGDN